jgi:hypothetical protein
MGFWDGFWMICGSSVVCISDAVFGTVVFCFLLHAWMGWMTECFSQLRSEVLVSART